MEFKKDRDKARSKFLKKSAFNNFLCFNFNNFVVAAFAAAVAILVVAAIAVAIAIAVAELVEIFVILLLFEILVYSESSSSDSKNNSNGDTDDLTVVYLRLGFFLSKKLTKHDKSSL